jgi:small ligand-binding sensory domain FIST
MQNRAASRLVSQEYSEEVVATAARSCRESLGGPVTCALVFATPHYLPHLEDFLDTLRLEGHIPTVIGACAQGVIARRVEQEYGPAFSLLMLSLPAGRVKAMEIPRDLVDGETTPEEILRLTGLPKSEVNGFLMFLDSGAPISEDFMVAWSKAYPGVPTIGGLTGTGGGPETGNKLENASQDEASASESCLILDGHCGSGAGVLLALQGGVRLETIVSQGCRPIGSPLTVTSADQNMVFRMGNRTAYEVLDGVFQQLSDSEKANARGNLLAGLAGSEYLEEFRRGDFLIRNILGADPNSGAVVLGTRVRSGQTMQYQVRDRHAAEDDLRELCSRKAGHGINPCAALIFSCVGRGRRFFGSPHHDALEVARHFDDPPAAGFFCDGEIGPICEGTHLHAYTASIGLIV